MVIFALDWIAVYLGSILVAVYPDTITTQMFYLPTRTVAVVQGDPFSIGVSVSKTLMRGKHAHCPQ
jgi:hypothetical protein